MADGERRSMCERVRRAELSLLPLHRATEARQLEGRRSSKVSDSDLIRMGLKAGETPSL